MFPLFDSEIDLCLQTQYELARARFAASAHGRLQNEKVERLWEDCKNNFSAVDFGFITELARALAERSRAEGLFLLAQAQRQCAQLLAHKKAP